MNTASIENWFFLGASRGLGRQSVLYWDRKVSGKTFYLSSRHLEQLQNVAKQVKNNRVEVVSVDFTSQEKQNHFFEFIGSQSLSFAILYFAGGGPYGDYEKHKWSSHLWAYELNFLFPAHLLHRVLLQNKCHLFLYIGSAVAENRPDAKAASYAAGKHGMKGLMTSVAGERQESSCLLRLFSPGYMDTDLLPPGAEPRQVKGRVSSPERVASTLFDWLGSSEGSFAHWSDEVSDL